MYPVFSLLRRLATVHIYATEPMLEVVDGTFHIKVDRPTYFLDLASKEWKGLSSLAPFSRLEIPAASSVEAAISIAKTENDLAGKIRAHDILYTMVVGPEGELHLDEGGVRRYCTYAIVRGVFRASSTEIKHQPTKNIQKAEFRKPPPGTVRL